MNYIIDKQTKEVIWINTDPNRLEGTAAWSNFDPGSHQIVFAVHYNPQVGETFKAAFRDGIVVEYQPKRVYHKITMLERILFQWDDEMDLETETEDEPLRDASGEILPNQIHVESGWILDFLPIQSEHLQSVERICESKIVSGFNSDALGSSHFYDSDRDDQLNLIGSVSLNASVPYKCTDKNDRKEYRIHSAPQIQQVLSDGAARKILLLQKAAALKASILSADSFEKLNAIDLNSDWD
ncbi:hypothetical protein [Leptospira santarosai]|uniref:DUF4376 domain-containing protein n=1 Tax=Leptospira santarosai TaxID=28183 RepID=UPI0002487ED2|nr:hypothetical protein [Leptospira santarosai]EMM77067.1 hypothetical protein LEP1GSC040_0099 [Leptospira santarosai str. 2000030832]